MRIKKNDKRNVNYIPLSDIEKINTEFLNEIERVKQRFSYIKDEPLMNAFYGVLLRAYTGAIEIQALEREVDYYVKVAEIKARAEELRPLRQRHWYWLFRTFPNRAQDIIDERAELEAEREHSAAEKQLDNEWEQLFPNREKPSKRELRRIAREQLQEAIERADSQTTSEAFAEPPTSENADTAAPPCDVGTVPIPTRRPRPPRSCRRPRA